MRVVLVIDDLRIAGAQRVIVQEARALHPRRAVFHVVALAADPDPSFTFELRTLGVTVSHVPGRGLRDVHRASALAGLIRRVRPDLVHTHLTYANILGTLAARLAGRPCVATIHNVDSNQRRFAAPKRWLEGLVLRRWATRIAIVAEGTRAGVARNFGVPPDHLVALPNAIDPGTVSLPAQFDRTHMRHALGLCRGESLLCTVGRLDPSKGQAEFLRALAHLRARDPMYPFRAVIVGDGPQKDRLQRLLENLGLADRVQLLGVRRDVAEIVAASDVFVLASLNEGLSQALLEAMALGTPVVATDVGGTGDAVVAGRTGWLVPAEDPIGLATAIVQVLGDRRQATTRAAAARQLIQAQFSLTSHVARLEDLYRVVATGAGAE
jgi:glycosyltransferase involved in cell wall biosynthesis